MKKRLDTSVMENELRSGSAFFRAVPQSQKEPEKAHPTPPSDEQNDGDPHAAGPGRSPLDNPPTIKPPRKEANLAPVVPLEQVQTQQPATPPPSEGNTKQTAREPEGRLDQLDSAPLPASDRAFPQNEVTNERTNEPLNVKRQKIRHTFDIYADQLLSLKEIQLHRAKVLEKHYRLGDLVQEALDGFITKERNKE